MRHRRGGTTPFPSSVARRSNITAGLNRPGKPRGPNAPRSSAHPKVLPIDVAAISMGELNNITGNFGQKALIGEGSYGQIYRAVLTSVEPVAIKKLDPSVSNDSEADFSAQMQLSMVSRLKNEYFIKLILEGASSFGFNIPPFQDQLMHHQSMHVPPYSSATMGLHSRSWPAPTYGYFQYAQPPHFYSGPLGLRVPRNQSADLPVQYSIVHPYASPAFSCMPPEPIHKAPASFMPPSLPYRNGTGQIGGHPHGDLNPDRQPSKLKPMGPKDAAEDINKSQDGSASFSLFQFNPPIAPPAPPSSEDDTTGELAAGTALAQVQAQPCSREQTDVEEYNLLSTKNGSIFPFI